MENRDQRPLSNPNHGSMGEHKDQNKKPGEGSGQEHDPAKGQGVAEKKRDPSGHGVGSEHDKGGQGRDKSSPGSQNDRPGQRQ
ncbi:MAG TPA: hypothetical protein VND87_04230 [Stellaceae bacterium]|nr:hypothetical protein [Stellaceae bacterium]